MSDAGYRGSCRGARVHKSSRAKGSFLLGGVQDQTVASRQVSESSVSCLVSRAISLVADDQRERRAALDAGRRK